MSTQYRATWITAEIPVRDKWPVGLEQALEEWTSEGGAYQLLDADSPANLILWIRFRGEIDGRKRNHLLDVAHRIGACGWKGSELHAQVDPCIGDPCTSYIDAHHNIADRFMGPSPETRADIAQAALLREMSETVDQHIAPKRGRPHAAGYRRDRVRESIGCAIAWSRVPRWVINTRFAEPGDDTEAMLGDCHDGEVYIVARALEAVKESLGYHSFDLPAGDIPVHTDIGDIESTIDELREQWQQAMLTPRDLLTIECGLSLLAERRDAGAAVFNTIAGFEESEQDRTGEDIDRVQRTIRTLRGVAETREPKRGD